MTPLIKICAGCGSKLGWKKYKFTRLWKIPGLYCKECMIKIGKNLDESTTGGLTLPKHKCSLCKNEFYFLRSVSTRDHVQVCYSCHDMVVNGEPLPQNMPLTQEPLLQNMPLTHIARERMPKSIFFAGGTSIIMMAAGLAFALYNAEGGSSFVFVLGSAATFMGFILFRKVMRLSRLLASKR